MMQLDQMMDPNNLLNPAHPLSPLNPLHPIHDTHTKVPTREHHSVQMDRVVLTWTGIIVTLILAGLIRMLWWRD